MFIWLLVVLLRSIVVVTFISADRTFMTGTTVVGIFIVGTSFVVLIGAWCALVTHK